MYRLLKCGDLYKIARGHKFIGTITFVKDSWQGRLRIKNGDALTARGRSPEEVFDTLMNERLKAPA